MTYRYPQLQPGEPFELNPQKESLRFACCDCGLVHRMEFIVGHRQRLRIAMWRLKRATGQLRRHREYPATIK